MRKRAQQVSFSTLAVDSLPTKPLTVSKDGKTIIERKKK